MHTARERVRQVADVLTRRVALFIGRQRTEHAAQQGKAREEVQVRLAAIEGARLREHEHTRFQRTELNRLLALARAHSLIGTSSHGGDGERDDTRGTADPAGAALTKQALGWLDATEFLCTNTSGRGQVPPTSTGADAAIAALQQWEQQQRSEFDALMQGLVSAAAVNGRAHVAEELMLVSRNTAIDSSGNNSKQ